MADECSLELPGGDLAAATITEQEERELRAIEQQIRSLLARKQALLDAARSRSQSRADSQQRRLSDESDDNDRSDDSDAGGHHQTLSRRAGRQRLVNERFLVTTYPGL